MFAWPGGGKLATSPKPTVDQLKLTGFALFGISTGGPTSIAYIIKHPERVTHLVLYGSFADGTRLAPDDVKASFLSFIRSAWGLGSKTLVDLMMPGADAETRAQSDRRVFR